MSTVQITPSHLARKAAIYIRQSSPGQVLHNRESQRLQYGLVDRAVTLGWPRSQVVMIDEDVGVSGRGGGITRIGFDRLVAEVGSNQYRRIDRSLARGSQQPRLVPAAGPVCACGYTHC